MKELDFGRCFDRAIVEVFKYVEKKAGEKIPEKAGKKLLTIVRKKHLIERGAEDRFQQLFQEFIRKEQPTEEKNGTEEKAGLSKFQLNIIWLEYIKGTKLAKKSAT